MDSCCKTGVRNSCSTGDISFHLPSGNVLHTEVMMYFVVFPIFDISEYPGILISILEIIRISRLISVITFFVFLMLCQSVFTLLKCKM